MPTRRLPDAEQWPKPKPCTHPDHNPPGMRVFEPGTYEHSCPACGRVTIFVVPERPRLLLDSKAIHFRCPNCGAEHQRGFFGKDAFRCLRCGYQGHGLHPDHEIDESLYQQWLKDNEYNRSVGAEEVPLGVDPKDFAS